MYGQDMPRELRGKEPLMTITAPVLGVSDFRGHFLYMKSEIIYYDYNFDKIIFIVLLLDKYRA